jgi:hypothetical protein
MPSNHTNDDDHDDGATSVVIKTSGNGNMCDYNFDRVGRWHHDHYHMRYQTEELCAMMYLPMELMTCV